MKTIAEQVVEADAEVISLKDQLLEATKQLEAAPDDEILLAQVEDLTVKTVKADDRADKLKAAERALAARAKQTEKTTTAPAIIDANTRDKNGPKNTGDVIVKTTLAMWYAYCEQKPLAQVFEERFSDQPYVKACFEYMRKTAVNPAMTTVAGWAAELTRTDTRGFIESVQPQSVAAALAPLTSLVNFNGAHSVKVPRRNPLPAVPTEPAWIGEAGVYPLTSFSVGSITLERYKLGSIVPFTRELLEQSVVDLEALLRDLLREQYALVLDQALLSAVAAVPGIRPAGLLNGLVAIPPTAGGGDDAVVTDIANLRAALRSARLGRRPVLLLNDNDVASAGMMRGAMGNFLFADEIARGSLVGVPFLASSNVPLHQAIIVDAAFIATALDTPEYEVSTVATLTEANADAVAPTQATGGALGAVGTAGQVPVDGGIKVVQDGSTAPAIAGYTSRSLWQTDTVAIKLRAPTSFKPMIDGAVAFTSPTTWTP